MKPEHFYNLFVNSYSLMELGFLRFASGFEAEMHAQSPASERDLSYEERDALAQKLLEEAEAGFMGRSPEEIMGPAVTFTSAEQEAILADWDAAEKELRPTQPSHASTSAATWSALMPAAS